MYGKKGGRVGEEYGAERGVGETQVKKDKGEEEQGGGG